MHKLSRFLFLLVTFSLIGLLLFKPESVLAQSGTVKWNYPSVINGPANISHYSFFSSTMQTEVGYTVYLPPGYEASNEYYPVIYFLHGINGNEWNYHNSTSGNANSLPSLIDAGALPKTIVIFPNGGKGLNYIDAVGDCTQTKACPETMLITELIPVVDATFRTYGTREARAIQGFSMGGIGSSYYATKYPELFSSVASLSSACYLLASCDDVQSQIIQNTVSLGSVKPAVKLSNGSEQLAITSWQSEYQGLLVNQNFSVAPLQVLTGIGHDVSAQLNVIVSSNTSFGLSLGLFHWAHFGDSPAPTITPSPQASPTPDPTIVPSPSISPIASPSPVASPTSAPSAVPTPSPSTRPGSTNSPRPSPTTRPKKTTNNEAITAVERLSADLNGNNVIDVQDFTALRELFLTESCEKNITGSCLIDIFDYNLLYTAYISQ